MRIHTWAYLAAALPVLALCLALRPAAPALLEARFEMSRANAHAVPYDAPRLIFHEDFTDGAFDDDSAGPGGANWRMSQGQGVAFRAPNNRPFAQTLSRIPSLGTEGWAGATWARWTDRNGNGAYNDGEMAPYYVDKRNEVCVLNFESFTDMARKPETYGVEVAMMEWSDSLAGNPHYSHDLSFESVHVMHVDHTQVPTQLTGNVENIENRDPEGVKYAHFSQNGGYPTDAELSRTWRNKVIWRNLPGQGKTNVESRGERMWADYTVGSEMNSQFNAGTPASKFDHVQITFYRSPLVVNPPFLCRQGVAPADAQVGILNCSLGITKKSDFTMDYRLDSADAAVLDRHWGLRDTVTLAHGDATNDNLVSVEDASALIAFWSGPGPASASARATYDPATGEVRLWAQGISSFYITSTQRSLRGVLAGGIVGESRAVTSSDSLMGGYTADVYRFDSLSLGAIAAMQLPAGNLYLTVNYKGSGVPEGFTLPLESSAFTHAKPTAPLRAIALPGGQGWQVPATVHKVRVVSLQGQVLATYPADGLPARLPGTVSHAVLLQALDERGRTLATRKLAL